MSNVTPPVEAGPLKQGEVSNGLKERKVVVHLGSGSVLKGVIACPNDHDPEALFENEEIVEIEMRLLEAEEWMRIPIDDVKAIFFVKSFRGDAKRKALRFYSNGPDLGPIWAEIRFHDNEVLEGKIDNTARHLVGKGFVMHPTDSGGNNLMVYVNKKAVRGYRVLGVRANREQRD